MIQEIKDLEKLLKLLRKQGVTEITLPEVSLKLGELPVKQQDLEDNNEENFDTRFDEPLTPEELISFANGGN